VNNQEGEERVDIGYGSVRRKDLTTPVNKLNIKNSRYANYSNIYDMLKGTVPGLQVSGTRITIQGTSSFNLSTEPLFIVDGMQTNSIGDISPSQVESVEVLKGSSASIYGSRGANGVILIKLIGANTNR
jgi:TonB-dependent SusC/RagA subfamily outer membrane receptor